MARPLLALRALSVRAARRFSRLRDWLALARARIVARSAALRFTPEPLGAGDAARAARLAAGEALLAGRLVQLRSRPAFAVAPPSSDWAAALHGYDWLDDAHAASRPDRAALRALAFEGLRRGAFAGWRADLAGRRLARLVTATPVLDAGSDPADRATLRRAVGVHLAFLRARVAAAPPEGRLWAATGLVLGALACDAPQARLRNATAALGAAAAAASGPLDAARHRNPQALAEGFALLAWTAEALRERGVGLDPRHAAALAAAGPALRALRLGDGALMRIHGGGLAADGALDEALARAGPQARGPRLAEAMGVQRVVGGRATLLLDAAVPPGSPLASASTLAVEFSVGRTRLFGAVGAGAALGADWALASRATAAFSAVEVDGVSAARLAPDGLIARTFGRRFASGPAQVASVRDEADDALWIQAEHDGYRARFGLVVSRRLRLSRDGLDLRGEDTLTAADATARARFDRAARGAGGVPFCVRFHLDPAIVADVTGDGDSAVLILPDGALWRLRASGGALSLAQGISLDDVAGVARPASQLVISARAEAYWGRVTWALAQSAAAPRAAPVDPAREAVGR